MNHQAAIERVSLSQAVNAECLTPIVHIDTSGTFNGRNREAFQSLLEPMACFYNALVTSSMRPNPNFVMGYVLSGDGIVFEHCWNQEQDGQHFDMTSALYWQKSEQDQYFALVSMSAEDALNLASAHNQLDFTLLRGLPEYNHLWRKRR